MTTSSERLLLDLSIGAPRGSWFYIEDGRTGFSAKVGPRPWVLIADWNGSPTCRGRARSLTGGGLPHDPHPQRPPHGPCHVKDPGGRMSDFRSLHSGLLKGTY